MTPRVPCALIALTVACGDSHTPTVAPAPVAVPASAPVPAPAPVAVVPDAPLPSPVLDDATFATWLTRVDWTPLIDKTVGFVALTGEVGQSVTIRRWCLPRGATYAKFEALDLAAEVTSDPRATTRCDMVDATTVDCGESGGGGRHHRFRVARRAERLILVGIESFADGEITPADHQRYESELASDGTCD